MRSLPTLAGEKVILRPFDGSKERARAHQRWRNDSSVMRWHYVRPRTDLSEERSRIRRLQDSLDDWAWDIFASGPDGTWTHVGYVILHLASRVHRHGELAITVGETTFWGRGVGREALALVIDRAFSDEQRLHRVFLNVAASNERAVRCYRALGFVEEGRKREHLLVDDRWEDDLVMSVLDREWSARKAGAAASLRSGGPVWTT